MFGRVEHAAGVTVEIALRIERAARLGVNVMFFKTKDPGKHTTAVEIISIGTAPGICRLVLCLCSTNSSMSLATPQGQRDSRKGVDAGQMLW